MRVRKTLVVLTVAFAAVGMLAASMGTARVDAGVISYVKLNPMTADADSGISTANDYTHLLDFGNRAPATVNGVPFTQVNAATMDAIPYFRYAVNTSGRNSHGGNTNTGVDGSQGINELVYDMIYNGGCAAGGVATITLGGLVPGEQYETRIYNRQWSFSTDRTATWEFDTDGLPGAEDTIAMINQDDASQSPPSDGTYGNNTAYAISYQFTATESPLTISITQHNLNYAWHVYGLTNQEPTVDNLIWDGHPPDTWDSQNWQWPAGTPSTDTPDVHTNTTVRNDTVTVAGDAKARTLTVDSGGVKVDTGGSLWVARDATFAPGLELELAAGAAFSAGGGNVDDLTTAGDASIGVGFEEFSVLELTGAAGTISKQGAGTLRLDNRSGGVAVDPATVFKVEEGVLYSRGQAPLGQASLIEMAGGTMWLEGAATPIPGPAGSIAHYEFDSVTAGTTPNTGSAGALLDGTLNGDATLTTGGRGIIGEAMKFSGAGYVEVPYDAVLGLNEFSVSAWVKVDHDPAGPYGILGTRIGAGNTFDLKVQPTMIHGDVGDGTNWIDTTVDIRPEDTGSTGSGGDISPDMWHLVTYVIDDTNKNFDLYLDGDLKRTIPYTGMPLFMQNTQVLWIGDDYSGHEPMNGLIDEVYIYGRALDSTEVSDLWGGGLGPNDGNVGVNLSGVSVLVTADSTLFVAHGALGGGPAEFADLTLRGGALTTSGTPEGFEFASTTIHPDATAVGFDPQSPTDYNLITNNSTQPEVVVSKTGPSTWSLDTPFSGTTSNISWKVEDGTMIVRGADTFSTRPIEVAGGTLDMVGETSSGGAPITMSGGMLRLTGTPGTPAPGPAGAIAHYALDSESAGITSNDGTAGSLLDGVLYGDAALTTGGGGLIGEAAQFGGTGYIEVTYDAALALNEYTVSAWVKVDHEPTHNYGILGTRISTDETGTGGDTFDYKVTSNMIHGDVGNGAGWISIVVDIGAGDTGNGGGGGDLSLNEWHLVTYVIDDTNKQFDLYLDGDLKRTMPYSGTPLLMQAGQKLWIGDDYFSHTEPMVGLIDEVNIYGRALEADEVADLWGSGFGPNDGTAGLDMSHTDLSVTADSTIYTVYGGPGGGAVPFRDLMLENGVLTAIGSGVGISFTGTTIPNDATAVGFDTQAPVQPGAIDGGGAEVTISKLGQADLVLDEPGTNLQKATFDVQAGRIIGVHGSNPFGEAGLQLAGGSVVLAGETSDASVHYDNAVAVTADGTLTAGPGNTGTTGVAVTLGSVDKGVTLSPGVNLTLESTDGYTLDVAGEVTGAGAVGVPQGQVSLSRGGDFASLAVAEATVNTTAGVTVDSLSVLGTSQVNTDAVGVTVNDGGVMQLGLITYATTGGSLTADGLIDADGVENLTLGGGTVTLTAPAITPGLRYHPITNDADSGIDSSKTYTHAIDLGSSGTATVNGVVFANAFVGNGSENFPTPHVGDAGAPVTGEVAKVFQDMEFGADPGTVILTGLTPGTTYDLRLYNRAWRQNDNRSQVFQYDVNNDGSIEDSVTLDQDNAAADPPGLDAWDRANAMSYVYTAGLAGEIKVDIDALTAATYHLYGLTNEEVPPAGTDIILNNLSGTGTLVATSIVITGTLSPGGSVGTLNVDGELELVDGTYLCEIDSTGADLIHNANNDEGIILSYEDVGGTLELLVLEALGDAGCYTHTIISTSAAGIIEGDFPDGQKPPEGDYLDHGVFLDSYDITDNTYNLNLFQAGQGDTDGDGDVDLDDLSVLDDGWDPTAEDKIWTDGDVDGDGDVDLDDLSLLDDNWAPAGYPVVNCPLGGGGEGAAPVPEPGTLALLAIGLLGLALWRWRRAGRG